MSNEYLESFTVGTVDCLSLGNIEETSAVISFLRGEIQHVVPAATYATPATLKGVFGKLSAASINNGYYLTCINTYLDNDGTLATSYDSPPYNMSNFDVPYNGDDSYTFVIANQEFWTMKSNTALIDSAFIKAYGVKFVTGEETPVEPPEEPPVDPPEEPPIEPPTEPPEEPSDNIWNGGRTFVTIRDNDTLEELGLAYDLMNTRIYEQINNKYTLDFNILPYFNVYRIMHPNFLEINNDYFRIRRVEKQRNNTLMMAISCEHISYELNNQYDLDSENEEIDLPDYPYTGTPFEILTEMLQGTRFTIGTVEFNEIVDFTSKPMGTRSMIIGLANHIGAEVKWDKFTISLLVRRGTVRDLTFEVGKNLISMTEVYDTHANGAYTRSYDVDVIDLSLIENEGVQEEMYDIRLGDTVTLIDEQFNINISQRIISYEVDPFRKALPTIELEHVRKTIASTVTEIESNPILQSAPSVQIYQENITRVAKSNAFGFSTAATYQYSHAEGESTKATREGAHAEGGLTTASGPYSHAEGWNTLAASSTAHAEGDSTKANGEKSHAEGHYSEASGYCSHAQGEFTKASGYRSHAEGYLTLASEVDAHAQGNSTTASGGFSHAGGQGTIANQDHSTAIGKYNKLLNVGDIFAIGIGSSDTSRSNGLRVTTTGATYGQSAFNSAGADYAEFFEWKDGNPENADRKGYFVTLDGDKIRPATSTDDYILGIVSVNPSVIGDSYQDQWANMYLTNEWGEIQKETVTVSATFHEDGREITPERVEIQPILNPNYDSESEYIPREQRPEWSPIGMMGKLLVRDDGTSIVNGYCKPNDQGIATSSTEGYRVMERVTENIIRVLVK